MLPYLSYRLTVVRTHTQLHCIVCESEANRPSVGPSIKQEVILILLSQGFEMHSFVFVCLLLIALCFILIRSRVDRATSWNKSQSVVLRESPFMNCDLSHDSHLLIDGGLLLFLNRYLVIYSHFDFLHLNGSN